MKVVNKPLRKKDAMQLVTGQPVYMDDVIPEGCLCVKLLRSPHANAYIKSIDTSRAMLVPGMEAVFTWQDVDQNGRRYTQAGQTYPEPSPYDRLVLDRHVRFVGDVVAILAGKDEKTVEKAMKLIKVEYEVLEPLLDFHTAKDNPVLVHPEDNWESLCPVGADNKRNLCAHEETGSGDVDEMLADIQQKLDALHALNEALPDPELSAAMTRMEKAGRSIMETVEASPAKAKQVRRFANYYLPDAVNVLEQYAKLARQGVRGENAASIRAEVERNAASIATAFENQLDALYAAESMDLSADLTVLQNMLKGQGLG